MTIQLKEINQTALVKEGRLKRYRERVKQYRQNRTFQSNERKFYLQVGRYGTKIYEQPNAREAKQFWSKIWHTREQKCRIDKRHGKRVSKTRRRAKTKMHISSLRTTLKDIKLEKARLWWHSWILVQEIHLHPCQTCTRNEQMSSRSRRTWMDDQRKNHIDPKWTPQKNRPKQLLTYNVPTYFVQNTNCTNNGRDLQATNCSARNRKETAKDPEAQDSYSTLISTFPTRARRDGNTYLWLGGTKKGVWYSPAKLEDKQPHNVSEEVINFIEKTMKTWRCNW